ncbi:MAG: glycosyltransferase family 4 protein [Phycisphaerae bacterium]
MRIGIVHNYYRIPGGEDKVVETEARWLLQNGHDVFMFEVHNDVEIGGGLLGKARTGINATWNRDMARRIVEFCERHDLDILHTHNTFPILSPAIYKAANLAGVPVIQTLHNYRMLCANGCLIRRGEACTTCISDGPWNAVKNGCYRDSHLQSAAWAAMTTTHRALDTWNAHIERFLTPSDFARDLLSNAGVLERPVFTKPNCVADPGRHQETGRGGIYVGRLSEEKGVDMLIQSWRNLKPSQWSGQPTLTIVGAGPEEARLKMLAKDMPHVEFTGKLEKADLHQRVKSAAFVVAPSRCFETFGLTVVEGYALQRPAVVPSRTALAELVGDDRYGHVYEQLNVDALTSACQTLLNDPIRCFEMGQNARRYYEAQFTEEKVMPQLLRHYRECMASYHGKQHRRQKRATA